MTRLAALVALVVIAATACGGGRSAHGGSGVVTAGGRIGSLQIDVSTRADIVAFAGKPDVAKNGKNGWPGVPMYHALAYGCPDLNSPVVESCQAVYYVNARTHRLVAFSTRSPEFHTTQGIRPGMAQDNADRRAHQTPDGPWNAIGESSRTANLVLPSTCPRAPDGLCSATVEALMLESRHHPIGLLFT